MKIDKYFRTTNLNLAIFLCVKSCQIAGINPVGNKQKEFEFLDTPELEELVDLYKFGLKDDKLLMVPVHQYEHARSTLLDRLND